METTRIEHQTHYWWSLWRWLRAAFALKLVLLRMRHERIHVRCPLLRRLFGFASQVAPTHRVLRNATINEALLC